MIPRAGPLQELVEKSDPVAPLVAEAMGIRHESVCDAPWVLEDAVEDLGGDLGDRFRVDVIGQQLADHHGRSSRRQASEEDATRRWHLAPVESDVGSSGLASMRQDELVYIGAQVTDSEHGGGGRVRDDGDVWVIQALPGRPGRIQLQPGSPQIKVVGFRGTSHPVDAMRHPLEQPGIDKPGQGIATRPRRP